MPQHTLPIVGAHFRPPAKALLQVLPSGAALTLVPEPENPYDQNAVAVFVEPSQIPEGQHEELEMQIAGWGMALAQVLDAPAHHLGFIPAKDAQVIQPAILASLTGQGLGGTLGFSFDGKPQVTFQTKGN